MKLQKKEAKIRVGSNVKIMHSAKKSYINKTGKIIGRKKDDFFPDTDIFLISVPHKERAIWQYGSELELISAKPKIDFQVSSDWGERNYQNNLG